MKKKILSLLIAFCFIAGLGLNIQCLAAQKSTGKTTGSQAQGYKQLSNKKKTRHSSSKYKKRKKIQNKKNVSNRSKSNDSKFCTKRRNNSYGNYVKDKHTQDLEQKKKKNKAAGNKSSKKTQNRNYKKRQNDRINNIVF